MNTITLTLTALLTLSSWSSAAGSLPVISDKDFADTLNEALLPFQAKDAFAQTGACGVVDAVTVRPFSLEEAVAGLTPCFSSLAAVYGTKLSLKPEAQGLAIETGLTSATSPLLRDLNYGLQKRHGFLMGHPVQVRRGTAPERRSRLQSVIDGCVRTMVISRIDSGADFLKVYGGCLKQEPSIKEAAPSKAHQLGLNVLAAGTQPEVESLNGVVAVRALNGLVEILVVAYPHPVALP